MIGLIFSIIAIVIAIIKYTAGRRESEDGYIFWKSKTSSEYEHRMVAEEVLGRTLQSGEIVHHINGRRKDNRISNLCVMSHFDHIKYHQWYDWVHETYGKYPRRETQLRKLRENFNGIILSEVIRNRSSTL